MKTKEDIEKMIECLQKKADVFKKEIDSHNEQIRALKWVLNTMDEVSGIHESLSKKFEKPDLA